MTNPWKTYGQALKRALWDNVTVVLHAPTLRCGWMDGGCFIAAHAVARIVDGELWGIVHGGVVQHVVVRTPDGAGVLDADGFATARTILTRWHKLYNFPGEISLVKLTQPGAPWADADTACQVGLADELERRLRAELPSSYPASYTGIASPRHPNPVLHQERSPLQYDHGYPVQRIVMYEPGVAPSATPQRYFDETYDTIKRVRGRTLKVPRKELVPGSGKDIVAFLDYHLVNRAGGASRFVGDKEIIDLKSTQQVVVIDFMSTRSDQKSKGIAGALVAELYRLYPHAAEIDWGKIMHPAAEKLWQRYRESGPNPGQHTRGRLHNPAEPAELTPSAMTTDQMRAVLRGIYMSVGGTRPQLEARLMHALAVRARFGAMSVDELSSMTVRELKAVLRSVDRSTAGDKAMLTASLRRFLALPLSPSAPRARPTRRMLAILWNNPFTGARELRSWLDDTDAARSFFAQRMENERWALDDARLHHNLVFVAPDVSLQSTDEGLPQTSDDDLERWAAIVRDVEGRSLPRVGLMMTNAEAHAREDRARLARLAQEGRQDNPRAIPLDDEAIWADTRNIVQQLHAHFTQVVKDRGKWAASAYGTLPQNFSLLPITMRLTARTHIGRKKVDEIYLRVHVHEEPGVAFIPTGTASLLKDGRNVVSLTVNGSYSVLDLAKATENDLGPFASQVHDVLRHEITHIADPAHGRSVPRYSATGRGFVNDLEAYFNDPLEVRAFMRELTDQIRRRLMFATMEADPSAVAHTIVRENRTFKAMTPHLTPANQKLLMRAMTKVAVEEVEKRNAEIRYRRPMINTREKAEEAAATVKRLLEHRYRDDGRGLGGGTGWIQSISVEPDPDEGYQIVVRTIPGEESKNPLTRVSQIAVVTNPRPRAKRRAP